MSIMGKFIATILISVIGAILFLNACGGDGSSKKDVTELAVSAEPEQHCPDYSYLKNVYFGELHLHTGLSWDAYPLGTRTGPDDAYRFAKGGELCRGNCEGDGNNGMIMQLTRPLDFAAVTDHGELLAETQLCTNPGNPAYDTQFCQDYRTDFPSDTIYGWAAEKQEIDFGELPERFDQICAQPGIDCREKAAEVWKGMVESAEQACEECSFTAFAAYEFSLAPRNTDLNRNIIFRNSDVTREPLSVYEIATAEELWAVLEEECLDADNDCDCISIPHNSNLSNGRKFTPEYLDEPDTDEQQKAAELRAMLEPLVEIYQQKGWMECRNGFSGIEYDPFCDCGKVREKDAPTCDGIPGEGGMMYEGCVSRYDFIRNVLKRGLGEELRIGVNPFKVGVIGGTDSHYGNPGQVEEYIGSLVVPLTVRLMEMDDNIPVKFNPGGLTAVWAEENTRDAIFDALKRREVYATTGTRLSVRLFGGWGFPADLCDNPNFVKLGYENGVPMGGNLPSRPDAVNAPIFAVIAQKDPGIDDHPGADLQQIQIIKGWIDQNGNEREKVFVVAGDPDNGASVNLDKCERIGSGQEELCTVWTDPEFDPEVPAFYYARVLENPSCSWRQYDCNKIAVSGIDQPESCSNDQWAKTIQERAVTSAIWYEPAE